MSALNLKSGLVIMVAAGFLTGCASTSTNNFISEIQKTDKAYGIVDYVFNEDHRIFKEICGMSEIAQYSQHYCDNKQDYQIVEVTVAMVPRKVYRKLFVPKNLAIKDGAILEYSPANIAGFKRVAAMQETGTCRWTGFTRSNAGGAAIGFVAGALIVPGIVLMTSGMDEGGVECDGWSYKTLRNKKEAT
ncbi:MAG: hypothetical protein IT497_09835 [Ottowia sp.]|nr:hypothetical protein [Ottowia sp.]